MHGTEGDSEDFENGFFFPEPPSPNLFTEAPTPEFIGKTESGIQKHKLVSISHQNVCCCSNSLVATSIIFDGQNIIKTHLLILPDFTEVPTELQDGLADC